MKKYFQFLALLLLPASLAALEVNIPRTWHTGETPKARIWTSSQGKLFFRVYKIEDPESFLSGQSDPHTIKLEAERRTAGPVKMWKSLTENLKWSLHAGARRYMTSADREILREILHLHSYSYPYQDRFPDHNLFSPRNHPLEKEWSFSLPAERSWFSQELELPKLKPNFYLLEVSHGRAIVFIPLIISDLAILVKEGKSSRLVYALNQRTGAAMGDTDVLVFDNPYEDDSKKKKVFSGETNDAGVYYAPPGDTSEAPQRLLYLARNGTHYALSDLYYYGRESQKTLRSGIFSDRPVYRQGNDVSFAGFVYESKPDGTLKVPSGSHKVTVYDPARKKVKEMSTELGDTGKFAGSLSLSEACALGYYSIEMDIDGTITSGGFYVEQYKKPDFKVEVASAEPIVYSGQTASFTIKAAYYTGEPLTKGKIEYSLERRKVYYPWWWGYDYSWYYSESSDYYGWEYVKGKSLELGPNGELKITESLPALKDADYSYRVTARVTGSTNETISGSGQFKLVRSDLTLQLSQNRWYYETAQKIDLLVNVRSWAGKIDSGRDVTAKLFHDASTSKVKNIKQIQELKTKSDQNGAAFFTFEKVKDPGRYFIEVKSKDASGRETTETQSMYIYNPWGGSSEVNQESVTMSLDKTKYSPGETAQIRITSPLQNGSLLLTEEAEEILGFQIVQIKGGNGTAKIELRDQLLPNVRIAAQGYKTGESLTSLAGEVEIIVPPSHKFITMQISADREVFRPGEIGTFVVRTLDYKGKPVEADFAISVVDEAIFAIRESEFSDITRRIYPRRPYSVYSAESTAFSFYGYGKEVDLYARLKEGRERFLADFKDGNREVQVRKDFKDTAFWSAAGKTDKNGSAIVQFKFPDNLTQWRFTAHAAAEDGLVGSTVSKKIVKKDFAIRLALPRFVREKDTITLAGVIQNRHEKNLETEISFELDGLKLEQPAKTKVKIDSKTEFKQEFKVSAASYPQNGKAKIRMTAIAEAGFDSDAIEVDLPILPFGVRQSVTETLTLKGDQQNGKIKIALPDSARQEARLLKVSFIPGALPAIVESLPYLVSYPYGCVEQTLSTFIPTLTARKLAKSFDLALPVSEAEAEKFTRAGIDKLIGYQHTDGGWGWWKDDETSPYMTAYTLEGFAAARDFKVSFDSEITKKGVANLQNALKKKDLGLEERVYMQYVSTLWNAAASDTVKIWQKDLQGGLQNPYLLSLIARGAKNLKATSLEQEALAKLAKNKKTNIAGTYFENTSNSYYWYNDAEESTAHALLAFSGNEQYLKKEATQIVSWIIAKKRENRWRSTKSTSLMIKALAEYAEKTGESTKSSEVTITFGGTSKNLKLDPEESYDYSLVLPVSGNSADLDIKRTAKGFMQVRADWQFIGIGDALKSVKSDFIVERSFHKLISDGNGGYTLSRAPSTNFTTGDILASLVTVKGVQRSEYFLLEDNLPSGLQVLEGKESLKVSDLAYSWRNRPAARERYDDKIAQSKTWFSENDWRAVTIMRANFPGSYSVMPAESGLMYYPETNARTSDARIIVR